MALLQPTIRARIPKIPRYKFEMAMNAGLRSFSTNIQMFYCDHGQDFTTGTLLGTAPLPARASPDRTRRTPPLLSPDGPGLLGVRGYIMLPDGFDEIVELMSASKLYDLQKLEGLSNPVKAIATGKLKLLRRAADTQTIDDVPNATMEMPDSSISQWGLMISRM